MARKKRILIFVFLGLLISIPCWSGEETKDLMANYFHLALPGKDQATIYIQEDREFLVFPAVDNQDYLRLCSGAWRANNRKQTVTFRGNNKCRILNGTYRLSHQRDGLTLQSQEKNFVLKYLN